MSRKRHRRKKQQRPQVLVDVCIAVYGRFDLLAKCLEAIPDAIGDITYQVYLFDNDSPREDADEFYPTLDRSIRVIRSKHNLGFPKACNRMANASKSPLIFLLNSDIILDTGSIDLLVREMDNLKTGVVGMKLVFPEDAKGLEPNRRPAGKIQHIGLTTTIKTEIIHPFMGWSVDHPRVMAQREVFAVTAAAMMTRRSIWRKAKGFDEVYGGGTFEDVDFCCAVREMGYNIVVEPKASAVHYTNATAEKYGIGFPLHQNQMIFMQRWRDKITWWHYKQA
jgi:GT2 family glycosyltransferase